MIQRMPNRRRGAIHAVELLLLLPIFLLLASGMIQFSLMLSAQAKVSAASKEGARLASLGGDLNAIKKRIKKTLGKNVVKCAHITACITDENGNPRTTGQPVCVRIKVKTNVMVPDLLRFTGIQLGQREIVACTVMRKE